MNRDTSWRWLLLINLAAAFCNVGAALLAQLNWQLWGYVGNDQFEAYHFAWWHGIWWALFPVAGLALIGIFLQLKWRPPNVPLVALWLAVILQIIIYAGTILWWGPGQAQLTIIHMPDGSLNPAYTNLRDSNWIRVILFMVSGILQGWIGLRCFGLSTRPIADPFGQH